MQTNKIPQTDLTVSRLALGCAGLSAWNRNPISAEEVEAAAKLIHAAHDHGITLLDLADVYAFGKAESLLGKVLRQSPGLRGRTVIQSKCGQMFSELGFEGPIRVDLRHEHIRTAVEGSLRRLGTDRLDILLLHAADALIRPEEIAQAFDELQCAGKVLHFGVSNFDAHQIAILKKSVRQPVVINQIRLGLGNPELIAEGLELTIWMAKGDYKSPIPKASVRSGTIEYCRLNDIQVQAYAPLRGIIGAPAEGASNVKMVVDLLSHLAKQKNTSSMALALAWLLSHPAGIIPILGAKNIKHLIEDCAADCLTLSREEWYDLLVAATS